MTHYLDIHRWLLLADKMLAYNHLVCCYEVCNELEWQISQINNSGTSTKEMEQNIEKLKSIKRKLNTLIINNFPERTKKKLTIT
jgi:hypothetical protein